MLSIETKNLTKKFKEKTVVNGIELRINEGELFALLGTNGAGKTTTIKMLSTLILPTDGEIKINGLDIIKDRQKIKEIINVSPQETAIAPNLSVKENLVIFISQITIINNLFCITNKKASINFKSFIKFLINLLLCIFCKINHHITAYNKITS